MPTVKKGKNGYDIISRFRGRFNTHQLTSRAVALLQDRYGAIDGLEIDRATLSELVRSGEAYTNRQRRRWRKRDDELFSPPDPAPAPPPLPRLAPAIPPPEMIPCPQCRRRVISGAAFCNHCGGPMGRRASSRNVLGWFICVLLLVIIGLLWYAVAR